MLFDPTTTQAISDAATALLVIAAVYHLLLSVAVAVVARGRGWSATLWFFLAFVLTFFPAVLLLIAAGGTKSPHRRLDPPGPRVI